MPLCRPCSPPARTLRAAVLWPWSRAGPIPDHGCMRRLAVIRAGTAQPRSAGLGSIRRSPDRPLLPMHNSKEARKLCSYNKLALVWMTTYTQVASVAHYRFLSKIMPS